MPESPGAFCARFLDVLVRSLGRLLRVRARTGLFVPAPFGAGRSLGAWCLDVFVGALGRLLGVLRALLAHRSLLRGSLFLSPYSCVI